MYLNTFIVLWTVLSYAFISEVQSERFKSPRYLFSEEPNVLDDYHYTSQKESVRSVRSTDVEDSHGRFRRAVSSNPVPEPEIWHSQPLCDHDRLFMKWTDTNEVFESGAIIALCREVPSQSSTKKKTHAVFISYNHGKNWINKTGDFISAMNGTIPTINMYYTTPANPKFVIFADKVNKHIYWSTDEAKKIHPVSLPFVPDSISINPRDFKLIVASDSTSSAKLKRTRLYISTDGGRNFQLLKHFIDVTAFYWGDEKRGDKSTDLFIEGQKGVGTVHGWKLDCSDKSKPCSSQKLTADAPVNGDIVDFLVKGAYMFVTKEKKDKSQGVDLYVKYLRTGTFKKANIITRSVLKEVFVFDVSGGHVMLVVNHRKNETNLYNSLDITGSNYTLSLPRVLYHNPNTEVSSNWLRDAVKYRFVDVRRVKGFPSVYFATQLTVGPVGGRYLISKMTFDKGGVWQKVRGPDKRKYGSPCIYPACSLHVNLLYGSIYRYSKTTPLMSRKSAPGLIMATGVLGGNLKITPDTYLSRDGGSSFKQVLRGKRRFSFGDNGGFVLASEFSTSRYIQYSVDFENFYHARLSSSNFVDIKMILTQPGEKGLIFLVIGTVNGVYRVYHVNATKSLGLPCTKNDFYKVNISDIGVGGCAIKQIELRNSSSRCISGRNHSTVISNSYANCKCRRRHYQCGVKFAPDYSGSCRQIPGTNLIPSVCPEGQFFKISRGYELIPEYSSCTEDNETRKEWSYVRTPCPVEKLQLAKVTTLPEKKNGIIQIAHHDKLNVDVALQNGYLPHITFDYKFGNYSESFIAKNSTSIKMNNTGSYVLHIKASNPKSNFFYSVNVNVIRKLSNRMITVNSYPTEPSMKEPVILTALLNATHGGDMRQYGFPLNYHWKIETFDPTQRTIHEAKSLSPTSVYTFLKAGHHQVTVTVNNGISSASNFANIAVTKDLKPKNVKLSSPNSRVLRVTWDEVEEANIIRYRILYRKENDQVFQEAACQPKRVETQCDINNVAYYTRYIVKVDTVLNDGYGPQSDPVNIKTPSGKPDVPLNVKLTNEDTVTLEASWQPPKMPNGNITGYMYKFYKTSDNAPTSGKFTVASRLSFPRLEIDEDYAFEVAAKNEYFVGEYSEAIFARTGFDKPNFPPTEIATTQITATTATLRWTAPIVKNGSKIRFSPKGYNIYMEKNGVYTKVASPPNSEYTFKNLKPYTKYDVQISAVATGGEGPKASYRFVTFEGAPNAPRNLQATSVSSTAASFTWLPGVDGENILYYLLYQLSPETPRKPWKFYKTSGQVKNLIPYTTYIFAVTATNKINESAQSEKVTFKTKEDKPDMPVDVDAALVWPLSSSINVSWLPPKQPNGIIIGYTVSWHRESSFGEKGEQTVDADTRWLIIDHLAQQTYYGIQVQVRTSKGLGLGHFEKTLTGYYPYGSQPITILFEGKNDAENLANKKDFKRIFIQTVARIAGIGANRIADVRLDPKKNAVLFELISKKDLFDSTSSEILAEMEKVKDKLKPSFSFLGAKTMENKVTSGKPYSGGNASASGRGSGASSNMALVVGLVCAGLIIALILIIALMFVRYRRKGLYNKFDNQYQYNQDDDSISYQQSPEIELAPPPKKLRHKDIESVPLADADELT